jgi:chromate transport protein ChrA
VVAFTLLRTRSGRWAHVDASERHERAELNLFAGTLMLALAAAGQLLDAPPALVAALLLSGLLVLGGHLLRHRLKASLHVGFALLAAGIAWPVVPAAAALLLLAGLVAWSRLQLRRHTRADVVAGALLGIACAALYQVLPPLLR